MSVTPEVGRLCYEPRGGDYTIRVTYTGGMTYLTPVITYVQGGTGWLSCIDETLVESDEVDVVSYTFRTTSATGGGDTKIATVTFEDQTGTADITIYQITGYVPSWRGVVYEFSGSADSEVHYRIYGYRGDVDDIVYEGVAVVGLPVSVGDLVYDYIYPDRRLSIPSERLDFQSSYGYSIFRLVQVEGDTETDLMVWGETTDWSYQGYIGAGSQYMTSYDENIVMNDPINRKGCMNMMYSLCIYNADDSTDWTIVRTRKDGTSVSYNTSENKYPFGARNIYVDNNTSKITFKKGSDVLMEYDTTYCGDGSLIYRNRFGGYDSFLVEGNIRKKEDYTRDSYRRGTDRNSSRVVINNTVINNTYELTTGWLTDDEAERLVYHLLSSTNVTLLIYDDYQYTYAEPGQMTWHSVNIVDSSAEYKKFKNGRKMVQYVITVEEYKNIVKK